MNFENNNKINYYNKTKINIKVYNKAYQRFTINQLCLTGTSYQKTFDFVRRQSKSYKGNKRHHNKQEIEQEIGRLEKDA